MGTPAPFHSLPPEYLSTALTLTLPDAGEVQAHEAARRLGTTLHIITAWNPGDERPCLAENIRMNGRLEADLQAIASAVFPAVGRDILSDHLEISLAATGLDRGQAVELGRRYRPWAIFEVTGNEQRLVSCDDSSIATRPLDL